jgi:hypothetical protein
LVTLLLAPDAAKYAVAMSGGAGPGFPSASGGHAGVNGGGGAIIPHDANPAVGGCQDLASGSWGNNGAFCAVSNKKPKES